MVNPTITVRLGEEELRRLDELAQRMEKTRSDVVRDLINKFDEVLREEVERERKRWMMIGFVGALESAILDPEVILRFVRRNVDILGFPDFLIGMIRVRNRVVVFSHHDRTGSQLLELVRSRIEEEVRKEEMEIEREEDDEGDVGDGKSAPAYVIVHRGVPPRISRGAPVPSKYKLLINSRATPPTLRPIVADVGNRPTTDSEGGSAKAAVSPAVPEKQKLVATGLPNAGNPADSRAKGSDPQVNANGSGKELASPAGQGINRKVSGDFITALITQSYHKHRDRLLKLMESIMGD